MIMLLCFRDEFISESDQIRSVLDYYINITALAKRDQYYVALTGKKSIFLSTIRTRDDSSNLYFKNLYNSILMNMDELF